MTVSQYVDISSWQPDNIDWKSYVTWAKTQYDDNGNIIGHNGVSRVCIRASEFLGKEDTHYQEYKTGFLAAGGDILIHYAFVYPERNSPFDEADWMFKVVGNLATRPLDVIMLDLERPVPQATATWAYSWLARINQHYNGRKPTLYASDSYIRTRLQGLPALANFPLTLANWQFTPNERPPAPPPWKANTYIQYSDNVTVPGIGTKVDGDISLVQEASPPAPATHTDPLPVVLGSDGDFRLVRETFGTDIRYVVVAKHSSEDKLRKAGYL